MSIPLMNAAALIAVPAITAAHVRPFPVKLSAKPSAHNLSDELIEVFRISPSSLPAPASGLRALRTINGETYSFWAVALHRIGPSLWALLSTGSKEEPDHVDMGINVVHYLRDQEGGWRRVGEWLNLG